MIWFLRLILFGSIIYVIFRSFFSTAAKLKLACRRQTFYLIDDRKNVHRNFLFTYKGGLFEGEKYLGTAERASDVVSISLSFIEKVDLTNSDLLFIEKKILEYYPSAEIEWKRTKRPNYFKQK